MIVLKTNSYGKFDHALVLLYAGYTDSLKN